MTALQSAEAGSPVSASENLRPHCRKVGACVAKTPGKHCVSCAASSPEVRARKSAACQKAMTDPEKRARKVAAARRVAADPAITERKRAAMIRTHRRPDVRARHVEGCRRAMARRLSTEEGREQLREYGRRASMSANLRVNREKVGESIRAAHLAWCPPEYWEFNTQLKHKGFRLAERKAIIAEQLAAEARRAIAETTAAMLDKQRRERAQAY